MHPPCAQHLTHPLDAAAPTTTPPRMPHLSVLCSLCRGLKVCPLRPGKAASPSHISCCRKVGHREPHGRKLAAGLQLLLLLIAPCSSCSNSCSCMRPCCCHCLTAVTGVQLPAACGVHSPHASGVLRHFKLSQQSVAGGAKRSGPLLRNACRSCC